MLLQARAGFKLGFGRFSRAIRMDLMICKVHIANHSDMGCLCWYTPVYFGAGECGAGQGPGSTVHSCVPASHTYFYFVSLF